MKHTHLSFRVVSQGGDVAVGAGDEDEGAHGHVGGLGLVRHCGGGLRDARVETSEGVEGWRKMEGG